MVTQVSSVWYLQSWRIVHPQAGVCVECSTSTRDHDINGSNDIQCKSSIFARVKNKDPRRENGAPLIWQHFTTRVIFSYSFCTIGVIWGENDKASYPQMTPITHGTSIFQLEKTDSFRGPAKVLREYRKALIFSIAKLKSRADTGLQLRGYIFRCPSRGKWYLIFGVI